MPGTVGIKPIVIGKITVDVLNISVDIHPLVELGQSGE